MRITATLILLLASCVSVPPRSFTGNDFDTSESMLVWMLDDGRFAYTSVDRHLDRRTELETGSADELLAQRAERKAALSVMLHVRPTSAAKARLHRLLLACADAGVSFHVVRTFDDDDDIPPTNGDLHHRLEAAQERRVSRDRRRGLEPPSWRFPPFAAMLVPRPGGGVFTIERTARSAPAPEAVDKAVRRLLRMDTVRRPRVVLLLPGNATKSQEAARDALLRGLDQKFVVSVCRTSAELPVNANGRQLERFLEAAALEDLILRGPTIFD